MPPSPPSTPPPPPLLSLLRGLGLVVRPQGMTVGDSARPAIAQLAIDAMTELINMAQLEEPLWLRSPDGTNDILNEEEYAQHLSRGVGPRIDRLKTEATRVTAVVALDCRQLIDIFMNANSYESFFSSIVSTASTVEAFPAEVQGSDDKTLQLMKEEFRFPSPLVLKRECVFLRYCKQHGEGPWAVVDVSFDGHGYSEKINTDGRDYTKTTCRRRPSGCIIKTMQDGSSKVVWVEHVEVDDGGVHEMYKPFVNSGLAFGASQWITTIDRHVMAINNSIFEYNVDAEDGDTVLLGVAKKAIGEGGGVAGMDRIGAAGEDRGEG
ncbi:homeobox-leucine zipper protein ROC1-like isoform X1 [Ananas comosus]|uniref:Homeobox-leucine zipper protein ROC1-like isoform X1 n=1 Tax=Ananas comosus TaxID=4615 RepID=A0A6P5FLL2_ANACO|nr:homeobox-leucine zipper protein ROC1-like isoform X1 [Ananas comosus]XP_020096543.1 homeobox-leucine zipper protein ROC1-like isoform X1 [Ananas comosus]